MMYLNCPQCTDRLRFFDLWLLRLKNYQIQCKHCRRIFKISRGVDFIGTLLVFLGGALLFFAIVELLGAIQYLTSTTTGGFVPIILLGIIVPFIICGHVMFLGWHIKRTYEQESKEGKNDKEEHCGRP